MKVVVKVVETADKSVAVTVLQLADRKASAKAILKAER